MKFTVSTKLPFEIIKMVARRHMDEVDYEEDGEVAASTELLKVKLYLFAFQVKLISLSQLGENYEVAPRGSIEVYVGFVPPDWLFTVDSFQDRFFDGGLDICFGDGSTQV